MAEESKYITFYNDRKMIINQELAEKRGISDETIRQIQRLHLLREALKDIMATVENQELLPGLALTLQDLDFQLQDHWGFVRDPSFHRWFDVPRCTCPKLDNEENLGRSDMAIISSNCPVHAINPEVLHESKMDEFKDKVNEGFQDISDTAQKSWTKTKGFLGRGLTNLGKKLNKEE